MLAASLEPNVITIPYLARPHFRPFHASTKRFRYIVSHRRAGKSVALIVHMIIQCINNKRQQPPPKYAYVAPSFAAAKDLVWQYLKYYTANIPGMRYIEGELSAIFPHGGTIKLYGGADAVERLRGLHLDGAAMDEFPLLNQQAFSSIVRPALADYHGWAVVAGTPMGDTNAFYQLKLVADKDPENWEIFDIPISATAEDALTRDEVEALRRDMSADEFAREMMCSFVTPVAGAYYSESLNALRLAGRVAAVAPDLAADVITAWDLGIDDYTAIWLFQVCGAEIHFLCYIEDAGRNLEHYAREIEVWVAKHNLKARAHLLPHDVEAREYATGESRKDTLTRLLTAPIYTVPRNNPEDGINGVRRLLAKSWFDATGCRLGLSRLAGYHRNKSGKPAHDDNCHGADALRTAADGLPLVTGMSLSRYSSFSHPGPLRRRLRGVV